MASYNNRQPVSNLTQSKFYSPAFNAAIFDGPIRIYFAQYQEPSALKIYFQFQERLKDVLKLARESLKQARFNIFVMLYPNDELFGQSFVAVPDGEIVAMDRLGEDYVLGLSGPLREQDFAMISQHLDSLVQVCLPKREAFAEIV